MNPDSIEMHIINEIIQSAIDSVDPARAVKQAIHLEAGRFLHAGGQVYDLDRVEHIYVIGVGKGAQAMASGLIEVLENRVCGGVVIVKHLKEPNMQVGPIQILPGNHPVPGDESIASTRRLVEFAAAFTPRDLVFCVITGGGSALMTLPRPPVELRDLKRLTELLLASGATIQEMNTIRKHIDQVKGGGLARLVYPARLVTLILSDVIGSPLDMIASGPTVADPSTFADAARILRDYTIWEATPPVVRRLLEQGVQGNAPETVKAGDNCLHRVENIIVGDNLQACLAARRTCQANGFNSLILTTGLKGEARQAGAFLAAILREVVLSSNPLARPVCLIAGGETTVTLRGKGRGGRNQELALGAAHELSGLERVALVTLATDGEDGPTDAAGAIVTGETWSRAIALGMEPTIYLENNDSNTFFKALDNTLRVGPTGTNVNDITFLFAF